MSLQVGPELSPPTLGIELALHSMRRDRDEIENRHGEGLGFHPVCEPGGVSMPTM